MIDDSVHDFFSEGGAAAKFPTMGTLVKGTVLGYVTSQQRDFDTKKPLFWDDGNPRMQVVVTLQTEQRDPEIENDDGIRDLYVKGQMQKAVSDALKAVGRGTRIAIGGTLAVKFVDEEPGKGNPTKIYQAQYRPPIALGGDLLGDPPSGPGVSSLVTAGAQAASAPPAPAQPAATDLI